MNQSKTFSKNNVRKDRLIEWALWSVTMISVIITFVIIYLLVSESLPFFKNVSILQFFTETEWYPLFESPKYGIIALLSGTLMTTAIALSVALPLGIIAAVYLSEFVPPAIKEYLKPLLELLAAVPTVVYGYFALLYVTPALQKVLPVSGFNALSAGLVMGVMILPYICSLTEDAMRAVPSSLREASYALGANKVQTAFAVILPAAFSGVISAAILAISRAIGETMVVAIAAGMEPKFSFNPMESTETLTAYIVQVTHGDLPHGSLGYQTIYVVGLTLFLMTYFMNFLGLLIRQRIQRTGQIK